MLARVATCLQVLEALAVGALQSVECGAVLLLVVGTFLLQTLDLSLVLVREQLQIGDLFFKRPMQLQRVDAALAAARQTPRQPLDEVFWVEWLLEQPTT